ncbi:MAG: hypothetical protein QM756_01815 [Polyangiaceae bacterium]
MMTKIVLGTPGSTAQSLDVCAGSFILDPQILGPFQTGKVWGMTLFDTEIEAAGISKLTAQCDTELTIGMCGPSFAAYLKLDLPSVTRDSAGPLKTVSLRFDGAAGYKAGFFLGITLSVGMSITLSTWKITLPECSVSPVHCHTEGVHCSHHHWHIHCEGPHTTCEGGEVHCTEGSARFAKVLGIEFDADIDLIAVMADALGLTSIKGNIDISSQASINLADALQASSKLKATFLCQINMINEIPELRLANEALKDMGGSIAMGPEFSITLQTQISLTAFTIDGTHYKNLTWGSDANGALVQGTIDPAAQTKKTGFDLSFRYDTSLVFSAGIFATVKAFKVLSIEGRFDIPVFSIGSQPGDSHD